MKTRRYTGEPNLESLIDLGLATIYDDFVNNDSIAPTALLLTERDPRTGLSWPGGQRLIYIPLEMGPAPQRDALALALRQLARKAHAKLAVIYYEAWFKVHALDDDSNIEHLQKVGVKDLPDKKECAFLAAYERGKDSKWMFAEITRNPDTIHEYENYPINEGGWDRWSSMLEY